MLAQYILPHHQVSRLAGWLANCQLPWLKNYLIRYFITRYAVNMDEAIESNPYNYPSYNDFFTRQLKHDARPIDKSPGAFVSPADSTISQWGTIEQYQIFQAKGHNYTVFDLLGGEPIDCQPFQNGQFITLYLAPTDYHRVHMPLSGHLSKMIYVPGKLFSVQPKTVDSVPQLFSRNERVISLFDTQQGKMAVILVGAMIAGGMETVWAGQVAPPRAKKIMRWDYTNTKQDNQFIALGQGEEMGLFRFGSTVIVLLEKETIHWQDINIGQHINMGQLLGTTQTK